MKSIGLYPVLRAAQTYFPFIRRAKFELYIFLTRYFGLRIEHEFRILSHLSNVNTAIDIGGNWGQSIEAMRRTCAPKRIVCIEPNPHLASRLKSKYRSNKEISILESALSDTPGELPLFVPHYRGFVYDGLASLDRESAEEWLNEVRVAGFDRTKLKIEEHRVEIVTLDSLGLSPDVVKIDVQGHELQVIKGGRDTYSRSQPITIVETPNETVVALLEEYGLRPYRYSNGRLVEGETGTLNTIFMGRRDRERLASLITRASNMDDVDQPAGVVRAISQA